MARIRSEKLRPNKTTRATTLRVATDRRTVGSTRGTMINLDKNKVAEGAMSPSPEVGRT